MKMCLLIESSGRDTTRDIHEAVKRLTHHSESFVLMGSIVDIIAILDVPFVETAGLIMEDIRRMTGCKRADIYPVVA